MECGVSYALNILHDILGFDTQENVSQMSG